MLLGAAAERAMYKTKWILASPQNLRERPLSAGSMKRRTPVLTGLYALECPELDWQERCASTSESQVAVELHCQQHVVVLAVSDDGPGIPLADRESVFERFTRLDPARNRTHSGVGLGLAISRTIAQRDGGDVHVEDPGILPGARLVVRLPRRQDD